MWGFAADTGLCAMRLICSGLFDEYPQLKIVLGHLGEAIPFWLWRIDNMWQRTPLAQERKKIPSQYFKDNFAITTSGMLSEPTLLYTVSILSADNILFAIDYPMESSEEATQFMQKVPLEHNDKEKIYHVNAERIFSL
jgi:5-carboxyvanillate decarboxylase